MRLRPLGPRARNWLMAIGVIGVCSSAEHALAFAHGVDRVEIHRERRVQRVIGFVGVLDARDAEIGGVVAGVEHHAGERLLAGLGEEFGREQRQFLGNQERIAAAAHV
jgi:hypothetical protein